MPLDLNNFAFALKTLYPEGIPSLVYKDNPFLAMVRKNTKFFGKDMEVPLIYGHTGSESAEIAEAWDNDSNTSGVAFRITRAKNFSVARVDNEAMMASEDNSGAIIEAWKTEMDGAIQKVKNALGHAVASDGSGCIGALSSVAAGVITLTNADDIVHYEKGDRLVSSTARTGGSLDAGYGVVTKVDRDAGSFTYTAVSSWDPQVASFLFKKGTYGKRIKGVAAWLPWTKPAANESFFGVDRSVDVVRMSGVRFDGSAMTYQDAFISAASRVGREEGAPNYAFVAFEDYKNFELEMADKKQIVQIEAKVKDAEGKVVATIGFEGLRIKTPRGNMDVIADKNFQRGYGYGLTMDTWCLHSLGDAPQVIKDPQDGKIVRRIQGTDNFGTEVAAYSQLACNAPGRNFVIKLPTAA